MDHDERLAALRLHLVTGIGPRLFAALVEHFGSARAAAEASAGALAAVRGIGPDSAARLREGIAAADPETEMAKADAAGVRILVRGDPDYPIALTYLTDAPPVLYVKGTLVPEDAQAMAVVGMRKCSLYGQDQAERLAGGLARCGFTIVSGLARGIDSAAHRGAMAAGGRTIAVLGNGLATVYPPENRKLAEAVVARGALVTEFPMDFGVAAENFPRRNRIIAALSMGVIVVEAGRQSGALITARLGAELGKEVFAVPNRVDAPGAAGAHALIRDGAKLVESVADVLEEFPDLGLQAPAAADAGAGPAPAPGDPPAAAARQGTLGLRASLSPEESRIMEVMDGEPLTLDTLIQRTGLAPARVSGALTLLELKGLVRALTGGRFALRKAT
ncbi:MAG: DNA-protecting protein DprA [Planctomycetes bacterium]|nr:DNA-protecting protein DprA [Planctomycetota bacterium]